MVSSHTPSSIIAVILAAASFLSSATAVTFDWAEVGDPGNAPDSTGFGSVSYVYEISKYETTIAQYAEFLNKVAKSDPYKLWNIGMSHNISGIFRSGTDGNYSYSHSVSAGQRPIAYVTWFNAARFINWIHNGQGSGGTENGVYELNGAMTGAGFTPSKGAKFQLPSQNEWYKAAYYDPTKGTSGGYWLHATRSDTLQGNLLGVPGSANHLHEGIYAKEANSLSTNLTRVGAYAESPSYYGTYDQAGNVREWVGAFVSSVSAVVRGGSWINTENNLRSIYPNALGTSDTHGFGNVGFRIVMNADPFVVQVEWATVGNPANPADANGVGAVPYVYRISKFETSIRQYAAFLNAVAKSDPYQLWRTGMAVDLSGIFRSGTDGNYFYTVADESRPVAHVTWFSAARFVNWMHNGQGDADTETGVYLLDGAMESGVFTPQPGAKFWLPSEDEWYKAAYYDPTKGGGGGYWLHATRSDTLSGNIIGVSGSANYYHDENFAQDANELSHPLSDVGAFVASASYYGTSDQAGNLREWLGTFIDTSVLLRGGSWLNNEPNLRSSVSSILAPNVTSGIGNVGFRIAGLVEPESIVLRVTGVEKTADLLTIRFEDQPAASGWRVMASADLTEFNIDETAGTIITEVSPGSYSAVVDVTGRPAKYFIRIER